MRSVDNDDGGGREHVGGSMTEANDRVNAWEVLSVVCDTLLT
jgi:hypothetical protein